MSTTWSKNYVLPQRRQYIPFHCQMIKAIGQWSCKSVCALLSLALHRVSLSLCIFRMVSSYLVHHGYSSTAEKFSEITGQSFTEPIASIKTRQSKLKTSFTFSIANTHFLLEILKLVQMGRIGQAIEQTQRAYPGLLESNQNLMFMLKCRQFVEMVNGSDLDVRLHELKPSPS